MGKIELKPCPFCGSTNVQLRPTDSNYVYYHVQCNNCMAQGGARIWEEDAVAAWNQRAYEQMLDEKKNEM